MDKYVIMLHYVSNQENLDVYKKHSEAFEKAIGLAKGHLKFGLKLTSDQKNLDADMKEQLRQTTSKLPQEMWFLHEPEDTGAGSSFIQALYNHKFSINPSIVATGDLDQIIIDSEDGIGQIKELLKKMEKDNALYAVGSRDVPVILGAHKESSELRIIHELFHSLTIGSEMLKVNESKPGTTLAYAELGENSSGFVAVNHSHPNYTDLETGISNAIAKSNMSGFAAQYYTAIKSSSLGGIATGYVRCRENQFYHDKNLSQEFVHVLNLIANETLRLSATDIAGMLKSTMMNNDNAKKIARFYDEASVNLVREIISRVLQV